MSLARPPLRPRGGSLLKNAIAAGLVRLGQRSSRVAEDHRRINRRVAPPGADARLFNDSFVFQGSSAAGEMFMSRLGFREQGQRAEVWVLMELAGRKLVNLQPELTLNRPPENELAAGGLSYTYDPTGDRWEIRFDGPLSGADRCEVRLTYRPQTEIYLSSVHMDPVSTGKAMAEMPWSRAYFSKLRSERQVRMEQGGTLEGSISLDGARRALSFDAIRDHSWGKRDWSFLNRYIWNILSLGSPLILGGEPFTHLCYTTVDYGSSFRHLVSGWIAGPGRVLPIVAASDMHALAADGAIPQTYPIVFQPRGQRPIEGEVRRSPLNHSWLLQEGAFEVNEACCRVTVAGIEGQGMSEFGFSRGCGIPRPVFRDPRVTP